jgi:tyrosinase
VQNPDARLQPSNVGSNGNVFVEDNSMVDGDTPLLPFRRDPGSFWTTNEVMDWRLFGYDYPETQSATTATAQATIARLYSGSIRTRLATGQTGATVFHSAPGIVDDTYTDWTINAAAAPLDLPPSFIVQFSLIGDFSSDASTDVGMWSVLMPTEHNKAKRMIREAGKETVQVTPADMTMHGTVSLTSSLLDQIDAGKLESLDERDVVPFLREKLTWKVYSVSRQSVRLTTVANFNRVMAHSFLTPASMPSTSRSRAKSHTFLRTLTRELSTAMMLLHKLK